MKPVLHDQSGNDGDASLYAVADPEWVKWGRHWNQCLSGRLEGVRRKGVDESTELAQLPDDLLERECVAGKMKHLLDWN